MVKIIDIKDIKFKFTDSFTSLGFSEQSLLKPIENIEKDILDNYKIMQAKNFKAAEEKVHRWETSLKSLLSTPNRWGHGRRPALRKYPSSVSGDLADSLQIDLVRTITEKRWVYEFTGKATGGSTDGKDHAEITNSALNSGNRNVRWKNWFNETFDTGHSQSLIGARVLMNEIFRSV